MNMFKLIARLGVVALGAALAGCLVSETALLDAKNGRGRPLAPGLYNVCEHSQDSEPDCKKMAVTRDSTGLYRQVIQDEDEEPTLTRFRRVGRGVWLAQMSSEDDDGYFYFFGKEGDGVFVMTLIDCSALPPALREKYAARGEMDVDDDATVCTAKTLRAAVAAAKAYAAPDGPVPQSSMVYTRVGELAE